MASVLLLSLYLGSAMSAHRHLNPIADLVSDGPSDSGTFLLALGAPDGGRGARIAGCVVVDDDPCLACFWNDAQTLAAYSVSFAIVVSALPFRFERAVPFAGSLPLPRLINRGPPPFAR